MNKDVLPVLAPIWRWENPALGVGAVGMAKSSDEGNIGIGGMDNDGANVASVFQSNVVPGLAAIVRTVDTIAEGNIAANAGFARTDINYIGIGIGDGNSADGRGGMLLEERIQGVARIGGFPDAAGDSAKIESVGLARDSRYSNDASSTEWADEAPLHPTISLGVNWIDRRRGFGRFGRFGLLGLLRQ